MIHLASNCLLVDGNQRDTICDLQHSKFYIIPKSLSEYLISNTGKGELDVEDAIILNKLKELDIVLEIDEDDLGFFPSYHLGFDSPHFISNAIIDISSISNYSINDVIIQLDELLCPHIELRIFELFDLSLFSNIFNDLSLTKIESMDVYMPYDFYLENKNTILKLKKENLRFRWLFVHSTPNEELINSTNIDIQFTSEVVDDEKHCGMISPFYFFVTSSLFTESKKHNTCLNRKISIDANGNIKNCPSMPESYGSIKDTSLKEALEHPSFKKYWNIKKDDITKCKDCEFRHICTDCRAYRDNPEDPEDIYSAPLKCGYDPYTGKWEEWSTNPLKQKAIDYYEMRGELGFK